MIGTRCAAAPARCGWSAGGPRTEHFPSAGISDAHIVRGLIAILLNLYNGRTPAEIIRFDAPLAFARLGLKSSLSRQRTNGLASMVERIRAEAMAPA